MAQTVHVPGERAQGVAILYELLRAMRPKQWIKNVFVLAAIVFSEQRLWTQPDQIVLAIGAFVIFSAAASAIYLLNDLVDIEKDRAHPRKRRRPLASGRLSPVVAVIAAIVLLLLALPGAYLLDSFNEPDPSFLLVILTYLIVQGVLYTYVLKHMVILDVFTIAAGFVLRAVAGAVVLDIRITAWLLLVMGLLSLFLGFGKRRAELVLLEGGAGSHRRILDDYSLPMLDQLLAIVSAATIIAYTIFTINATTMPQEPYPVMLLTVPFVAYAIFRYIYLIHRREGGAGAPEELVLTDRPLAISIVLYGITVMALLFIYRAS